jgi:hypothetical protein
MEDDISIIPTSLTDIDVGGHINQRILKQLGAEILSLVKAEHLFLLRQFARSGKNQHRTKIRLFRGLLKDIVSWAERYDLLEDVAYKTRWWENYWYEREYGDSQFETLSSSQQLTLLKSRTKFGRDHVAICALIIDIQSLHADIIAAATSSAPVIRSIGRIASSPDWDDFRYLLDHAPEPMRKILINSIGLSIAKTNPAECSVLFIDFINNLRPEFGVSWSANMSKLFLSAPASDGNESAVSKGSLPGPTINWIKRERVNREYDKAIAGVAAEPAHQILEELVKLVA